MNDPQPNTISKYTTTSDPDSETVGASKQATFPALPFVPGSRRNPHNNPKHQLLRDKENLDSLRAFYRHLWACHVHGEKSVIVGVRTEESQEVLDATNPFRDFEEENTGGFLKTLEEEHEGSLLDRLR